ncbi:photosynthetic complex assembly protein PuhC [Rhodopseudomonas pseudopalustris]|uniref:Putative photosynthetic complex assembly protein n=2 Tax=Rhodopseudomonas TaxID=1073 RepID=Q132P0_RHOPS|nr:photosynthetic complex assembly protein PuhC [Rhodopseudomonas pseudopalustris]ABE40949.1 putative photosynthetic complex assembly protein [Rhodopseudomonas palustris BisB5]MBB1091025.1 phosphonate-binding protein [Rhodopseudomonas palustris]SEO61025.1 putative photosynthetic complex assembly protein [Rhodopseudomonas pseudopalustris]
MSEAAHNLSVPKGALIGAAAIVLFAIGAGATVRLTGYGHSHMTPPAIVESMDLTFEDSPDGVVNIYRASDHTLVRAIHPGESGFVRVAMRGLARERMLASVGSAPPFQLARHVNGQYTLTDSATKKVIDLNAFGADNLRAFSQLMASNQVNDQNTNKQKGGSE